MVKDDAQAVNIFEFKFHKQMVREIWENFITDPTKFLVKIVINSYTQDNIISIYYKIFFCGVSYEYFFLWWFVLEWYQKSVG